MEPGLETITDYLTRYGWTYREAGEQALRTGWFDCDRTFELEISISDTFVEMKLMLFEGMHMEWNKSPELLRYLMGVNTGLKQVRLGLDEAGGIILSGELPRQGLTYQVWEQTIGVVGYYTSFLYRDCLRQLSHFGLPRASFQPS